ncbi:hypothetical protein BBI17_007722 [Phytophthora kernoviae]|uniref:HRDC domain-containing protein n=3 Tax=Phytophthora kernoviae TaxID=325452 RepID=A0A421FCY6_9STRA|nr:hypothetical protein BBI17_007722 [Phytophthora kernoviae]
MRGNVGAGGVAAASPINNTTTAADWRDVVDRSVREAVHAKIVGTLRAFKPNAPPKVLERLPGLAYRMEESLFKLATNQAEYSDPSTLPQRIACIQENNAKRLLHQQQQQPPPSVSKKGAVSQDSDGAMQVSKPLAEEQARAVFQHLQTWRQKLVNVYGVAPWEILPNQTLAKVALYMPASEQELIVCGVHEEQVARFGSSLMQELHHLRGSAPTPSKPANRPIKSAATKQSRKSEAAKRASSGSVGGGSTKKRKNGNAALLAPAASPNVNSTSLMSPSQMMFQSSGVESLPATLPTLLPSASMPAAGANSANSSSSSTPVRLSPAGLAIQQPFFSRVQQPLPHQQQGLTPPAQQNHMHLLAQGAGQLSKQQDGKSLEAYEQEVQSLRWMLHQSQQEKSQLESEVQRLRAQLQGCSKLSKGMQTLVEGQTLLRDGRYRFLRRIGSGTFAVIMCVLDVQQKRHVAIKCVRQQELNALGEREAATLRRINEQDSAGACAGAFCRQRG